jgi:hypothetical protein
MAHNTPQSYTNERAAQRERQDHDKRMREKIRNDAIQLERQMNPNNPVVPIDDGPGIDQDQLREIERGRTNTIAQAPNQQGGGLQGLAYGGVPGQAYTEDIGMMGGLGAVAGPQLRFAYGGVPGQAYTEDIGMMGGLASVAGPQMRFAEGYTVPVWEDIKDIASAAAPYLGESAFTAANVLGAPVDAASATIDYLTGLKTGAGEGAVGGSDWFTSRLKKLGVKGYASDGTEEVTGETVDELGGEDPYLGEGYQGFEGFDEKKIEPEPEVEDVVDEEVEEEAWHKKYLGMDKRETIGASLMLVGGRTKDLVGVGKTLLSKKDSSALDKKYKESLIALSDAKTETEKGRASRDALKILSTMHKNNRDFRFKVRELANKIINQDTAQALKTWEAFAKAQPMYVMTMLEGQDAEAMKKNPEANIQKFKEIIARFSNAYPPQGQVKGTASVSETIETETKATGGSIPTTLSKLGISSIRKV